MNKLFVWMIASLLLGGVVFGQSSAGQSGAAPAVTVIRAGTLIDGKSDQPRRDQVIVVRGNRIESVSDARRARYLRAPP